MHLPKEDDVTEETTINSMIPIWKKKQKDVKDSEYEDFYTDYFVPREAGKYFIQIFELNNLHTPITGADFRCY